MPTPDYQRGAAPNCRGCLALEGAFVVLVLVQLFVVGLYFPPVFVYPSSFAPPHMIISLPVHMALWLYRATGTFVVVVAIQLLLAGLYLAPVFR